MDRIDFEAINGRLMKFNNELEMLINGCNDKEIKNYLRGCINGNNFCRSLIHGYTKYEPEQTTKDRNCLT